MWPSSICSLYEMKLLLCTLVSPRNGALRCCRKLFLCRNHPQIPSCAWNWGCQCSGPSSLTFPLALASRAQLTQPCPIHPHRRLYQLLPQQKCPRAPGLGSVPQCPCSANTTGCSAVSPWIAQPHTQFPSAAQARSQITTKILYMHLHDPLTTPSKFRATEFPFQTDPRGTSQLKTQQGY